jgi:hypothetical protein
VLSPLAQGPRRAFSSFSILSLCLSMHSSVDVFIYSFVMGVDFCVHDQA